MILALALHKLTHYTMLDERIPRTHLNDGDETIAVSIEMLPGRLSVG